MLSRTADSLFWLARYVERADFLARIIKATQRLATLPASYSGTGTEWESALDGITGIPRQVISNIRLYERYFYLSPTQ